MAAEDIGNLADYVLNGDNYEQVQPDGSVLEIPTVYQQQIIVPIGISGDRTKVDPLNQLFTWLFLDPSCTFDDSPYCVAHDRTTDYYFLAFNCNEIPIGLETQQDCESDCAAYMAQIDGGPLDAALPQWLINILYPTDLFNELPTLDIDFFFVACPGGTIVIPNFPGPVPPPNCVSPNLDPFNGACQLGYTLDGLCCVPKPQQQPCCTSYSFYGKGCCI